MKSPGKQLKKAKAEQKEKLDEFIDFLNEDKAETNCLICNRKMENPGQKICEHCKGRVAENEKNSNR